MKRNYWAAILLAFIVGSLGIQEFYLGNAFRGILGILFCWTFIPAIVALVQICVFLFKGEDYFNSKYNKEDISKKPLNE